MRSTSKKTETKAKASESFGKSQWVAVFFFICFGWITYETVLLARPFLPGFLGAVILGLIFEPLYRWVLQRLGRPNLSASILTFGIFLITVVPIIWIGQMALTETENLRPVLSAFVKNYELPSCVNDFLRPIYSFFDGFHIELKPFVLDKMEKMGARLDTIGAEMAKHILITIFNGIILMSTLFFVFRDGRKFSKMILSSIPIDPVNKQEIAGNVYQTFRAVVSGIFATAFIGGLADMVGFILAGVPLPIFFGLAATFLFLFGASFLVTVPAALWVMNHDIGWGIFLLIWGVLVSALGDNVLKPILMGSKAHMPFLIMLFSIFGGMKLYGFMGMFLGPMVVTAFLTFWSIYRKEYKPS